MQRVVSLAALLWLAAMVAGCGAAAVIQRNGAEQRQAKAQIVPLFAETQHECSSHLANQALDPIRNKVQFNATPPVPFYLLIINTTATPDEKNAIVIWSDDRADCAARLRQLFSTMPLPQSMPAEYQQRVRHGLIGFADQALQATNFLSASLYNGDLTYGEFNKRRGEVVTKLSAELNEWTAAMDAEDKARVLGQAQVAQQEVDAAINLVRVAACVNARGHFAQLMCR